MKPGGAAWQPLVSDHPALLQLTHEPALQLYDYLA